MKKLLCILSLCLFFIFFSAYAFTELISYEDIVFQEQFYARGEALSSSDDSEFKWESYNQWQCFKTDQLFFECVEYDSEIFVPSISVETDADIFHFDVHVEDKLDCQQTINIWKKLFQFGPQACIFAANLPDVDFDVENGKPQSLWYIQRLKGVQGYWDLNSEPFIE